MGDERLSPDVWDTEQPRPTLDDWLGGRVERKTREERKLDHKKRTQVRHERFMARYSAYHFRRNLYRRLFGE